MQKYRKRAVEVHAIQITEEDFTGDHPNPRHVPHVWYMPHTRTVEIISPTGVISGTIGDWILWHEGGFRGIFTEEQFTMNYEPCPDPDPIEGVAYVQEKAEPR